MHKFLFHRPALLTVGLSCVALTSAQAQTFQPIPLTTNSFTYEIVIPANYPYKLNSESANVTMDSGPTILTNGAAGFPPYSTYENTTFFEVGLNRSTAAATTTWGLPHGGTLFTNINEIDHVYQLPQWTTNNCVFIGNYPGYTTGNFVPTAPAAYTALSFLGSCGNGPGAFNLVVSYVDGTSQTINSAGFPDWFGTNGTPLGYINPQVTPNAAFAYSAQGRVNVSPGQGYSNTGSTSGTRIWTIDVALSDTTSAVTNIAFTWVSGGRMPVFAVSGTTTANSGAGNTGPLTGPFSPIAVTGYDADVVVESAPGNPPYTATMDNGTNILSGGYGANTWFEKGYDTASTNGFPVHGSVITSPTTGRTYQMAPTYNQNMAILLDTNHQQVAITPASPEGYVAFSLLTAGASINSGNTMTNYILLQHIDGVTESNVFLGKDWFDNTAGLSYAWIANARATFNNGRELANNDSNDPRLFESEFQMQDPTAVTNILIGFLQSPSANSTTYVLAVSATTNYLPITFGNYTPAQNVYPGKTATFSVVLSFGSFPSYQWQYVSAGVTNNLIDGGQVSGSLTPTLTITNVSSANLGFYQCLVQNQVSTNTSTAAQLTFLVSTLPDIARAGDPITDFGEALASPAGLGVANAIDGTLATYLNYAGSGSTTGPFQGPVGIIVTPTAGSSIVSALRFVTAVNAPICDPADFMLEGSNDGGNTWATVVTDTPLALPNQRNLSNTGAVNVTNQVLQEVNFANTASYTTYRLTVNHVKSDSTANSMQIAEIQFLGTLGLLPPGILTQPSSAQTLQTGASFTTSVVPNGPPPFTYQWYFNTTNSPISGATNSSYKLVNAQTTNAGNYFVIVSNAYGSTNSSNLVLKVVAPSSPYVTTILGDSPIAYFRLDEGSDNGAGNNGVTASDSVGGHNGSYSNVVLGVSGYSVHDPDTAASFGSIPDPNAPNGAVNDNMVYGINGINFGTPTNTSTNLSVEAWINSQAVQIAGAGIISQGFGNGGEQFALDTGGTTSALRFYFRNAGGASFGAASTYIPSVQTWHHVVGVLDESHNNEYLYVDGQMTVSNHLTPTAQQGVLVTNTQITIGARQSAGNTNFNFQFIGSIDEVAIYNYALRACLKNQILGWMDSNCPSEVAKLAGCITYCIRLI